MRETAIVFGGGPGLGWALARRFMTGNMQVGAVARDEAKLNYLIKSDGSFGVRPYAVDVSNSDDVLHVFDGVDRDLGAPDIVVFNAGAFQKDNVLDIDPADFERTMTFHGAPRCDQLTAPCVFDGPINGEWFGA
jgi:NAD(P)-dependent dehydrogenase (short-subunit alcohol dehydrogenase family)